MKRHFVYYLHDADGTVLYVGRSMNVARRIQTHAYQARAGTQPVHARKAEWLFGARDLSVSGPYEWDQAVAIERAEIRRLQPIGNIKQTKRDTWVLANREAVTA